MGAKCTPAAEAAIVHVITPSRSLLASQGGGGIPCAPVQGETGDGPLPRLAYPPRQLLLCPLFIATAKHYQCFVVSHMPSWQFIQPAHIAANQYSLHSLEQQCFNALHTWLPIQSIQKQGIKVQQFPV